jgi:hypothetical protein
VTGDHSHVGEARADRFGHWFGAAQDLERSIHRGRASATAEAEDWIASGRGHPLDCAWLLDAYRQLGVPEQFWRVDEAVFEGRRHLIYGADVDPEEVRAAALAERRVYLARVRANLENGLISGWRVLSGDPEAEADELEEDG